MKIKEVELLNKFIILSLRGVMFYDTYLMPRVA